MDVVTYVICTLGNMFNRLNVFGLYLRYLKGSLNYLVSILYRIMSILYYKYSVSYRIKNLGIAHH